eukprot:TRINITY_DN1461_c0_g1_i1.p1 TRINITY_DN1461_c0_g1~~TRINITY_DN1461_c0_g1_i1.p1  ORF type:complete len:945 (-),score=251.74 TRINITY_DN1461_c0_g1_i1:188-3022(-)
MSETKVYVACRFRPLLTSNENMNSGPTTFENMPNSLKLDICDDNSHLKLMHRDSLAFKCRLNHIFNVDTTQEEIFERLGAPLIQGITKGLNSTIFAYGQSGSGKSYSVFGEQGDLRGLTPRCCESLFQYINEQKLKDKNVSFSVLLSCVEIYCEELFDLLNFKNRRKLRVREHPKKGVYVEGLTHLEVGSHQDIMKQLDVALENRSVAETNLNRSSSRSHCLFTLHITRSLSSGSNLHAKFNLADLCGSEKIKKTGVTGQTLKEAKKINLSLSTLGHVIHLLAANKMSYIPFRDSKLTFILRESFGGNCRSVLLATCSPHSIHLNETISTLRFAEQAACISNIVKVNAQLSYDELKRLVKQLKEDNARLKERLSMFETNPDAIQSQVHKNEERNDMIQTTVESIPLDIEINYEDDNDFEEEKKKMMNKNEVLNCDPNDRKSKLRDQTNFLDTIGIETDDITIEYSETSETSEISESIETPETETPELENEVYLQVLSDENEIKLDNNNSNFLNKESNFLRKSLTLSRVPSVLSVLEESLDGHFGEFDTERLADFLINNASLFDSPLIASVINDEISDSASAEIDLLRQRLSESERERSRQEQHYKNIISELKISSSHINSSSTESNLTNENDVIKSQRCEIEQLQSELDLYKEKVDELLVKMEEQALQLFELEEDKADLVLTLKENREMFSSSRRPIVNNLKYDNQIIPIISMLCVDLQTWITLPGIFSRQRYAILASNCIYFFESPLDLFCEFRIVLVGCSISLEGSEMVIHTPTRIKRLIFAKTHVASKWNEMINDLKMNEISAESITPEATVLFQPSLDVQKIFDYSLTTMVGFLAKKTDFTKSYWHTRYFVLHDATLMYFFDDEVPHPNGTFSLTSCEIVPEDIKPFCMSVVFYDTITKRDGHYEKGEVTNKLYLCAKNQIEYGYWFRALTWATDAYSIT